MVKNILLVVMTIVSLMCFGYGYIQKIDADQKASLAVALKIEADRAKTEEMKAKDAATTALAEAALQRALAQAAIVNCQSKNK